MNTNHLIEASLKNNAGRQVLETAEGMVTPMAKVIPAWQAAKNKEAVHIRVDGKPVHYEVSDPVLLAAISSMIS